MTFTDIQHEGWISRLPPAWRPYALLMRLDRPVGWWLLLLPSWWGIMLSAGGMGGDASVRWRVDGCVLGGSNYHARRRVRYQ